jgi:hypothetical protein
MSCLCARYVELGEGIPERSVKYPSSPTRIPGAVVTVLEAAGHDIVWVRIAAPGTTDPDVLHGLRARSAFCSAEGRIVRRPTRQLPPRFGWPLPDRTDFCRRPRRLQLSAWRWKVKPSAPRDSAALRPSRGPRSRSVRRHVLYAIYEVDFRMKTTLNGQRPARYRKCDCVDRHESNQGP